MNLKFKQAQFLIFLLLSFMACTRNAPGTDELTKKKYSLYILAKDGKEYLLETNNLDKGILNPETDGIPISTTALSRALIVKNGNYYHLDRKEGSFVKYSIKNKTLKRVASVPLTDFSVENYYWKGQDTLLLTGLNVSDFSQVKYQLIHSSTMQPIASGNMNIPQPSGRFDNISVGFVELKGEKLLVGYTYHQQLSASNYTTSDTTYITQLNFPLMTAVKTGKDTRSTYPGGINTIQPYSFTDEAQNYYFMTCPGIALGNRPELPTGIMKISANDYAPDKNYFFNISASIIHNHAYGMWHLGKGKVLIRSERKDLFKGLGDHYSTAHFEFHVLDLNSRNIQKLALPLDKGTRRACVIPANDLAYISVNSSSEGNFIWIYNIKTGGLKRGLQLTGSTDFIMRIDQLNP